MVTARSISTHLPFLHQRLHLGEVHVLQLPRHVRAVTCLREDKDQEVSTSCCELFPEGSKPEARDWAFTVPSRSYLMHLKLQVVRPLGPSWPIPYPRGWSNRLPGIPWPNPSLAPGCWGSRLPGTETEASEATTDYHSHERMDQHAEPRRPCPGPPRPGHLLIHFSRVPTPPIPKPGSPRMTPKRGQKVTGGPPCTGMARASFILKVVPTEGGHTHAPSPPLGKALCYLLGERGAEG